MPISRHRLPTLAFLTTCVLSEMQSAFDPSLDDDDTCLDIRLVAGWKDSSNEDNWTVNVGSNDYDQWHGHCESSCFDMTVKPTKKAAHAIARELLGGVRSSIIQSEGK